MNNMIIYSLYYLPILIPTEHTIVLVMYNLTY